MFCAIALLASIVSFAQQADPAKPTEPKYTEVKYSADASSYRWEGEDRILALTGNVKFTQGDTTIQADKVEYREAPRTAVAVGNLKIFDNRNNITGDTATISFKEKRCVISGSVRVLAKPKPKPADATAKPGKTEWKDETTIACEKIDYLYKEKKAVIPSAVTIVQKTRTITADSATYNGKDEVLMLAGNVKGRDEKERHTFTAPKVTVSLKDDNQWVEAEKATGSFYVKEEEEAKPQPAVETKPAVSR